jgi:uncharacterized damage-inducible protein DinB
MGAKWRFFMVPFYAVLFDRFNNLHQEIRKAIEALPEDGLDWKPNEAMNSVNVLVTHLTGAERFLIGDIIMGESSNRNREAEFTAAGLSRGELLKRLDDTEAYLKGAFENLRLTDLETDRVHPRHGNQVSVAWALLHALEHTAEHMGHLQLTVQMYQLPDWEG